MVAVPSELPVKTKSPLVKVPVGALVMAGVGFFVGLGVGVLVGLGVGVLVGFGVGVFFGVEVSEDASVDISVMIVLSARATPEIAITPNSYVVPAARPSIVAVLLATVL